MDNIREENLKRLGKFIAEELINKALETNGDDWIEENMKDINLTNLEDDEE